MARNGRITARCRFCGTPVTYFGDLCTDCECLGTETNAALLAITAADTAALNARLDATAIGEGGDS